MSVIGIDVGTQSTTVANVGKGIIDIVLNAVSERSTPTVVGFGAKERLVGDEAMSVIRSNYKSTCRNFKNLLGVMSTDPAISVEQKWSLCPLTNGSNNLIGFQVEYKGEPKVVLPQQVLAVMLGNLKNMAGKFAGLPVAKAVVSVPGYFTDCQRQAVLDACEIADLQVLRLMNEHTATALTYGIYRSNEFKEKEPFNVVFFSMGHSYTYMCVAEFLKGKLKILSDVHDWQLGGRNMDMELMELVVGDFIKKTGDDPIELPKARVKLEEAAQKCKKVLSANQEAAVHVECLVGENDLSQMVQRTDFEAKCLPLRKRCEELTQQALQQSGLEPSAVHSVEIVGSASRTPWVQTCFAEMFPALQVCRTVNAEECVARGCALQAAMLSPMFKVRDFECHDTLAHPIALSWPLDPHARLEGGALDEKNIKTSLVFPAMSPLNYTKIITFNRSGPFEVFAHYHNALLPPSAITDLGHYRIDMAPRSETGKVKVRAKLNLSGTFCVEDAQLLEEEEVEEAVQEKRLKENADKKEAASTSEDSAMENSETDKSEKPTEMEYETITVMKKVKKTKRTALPVKLVAKKEGVLTIQQVKAAREEELEMLDSDRVVIEMRDIVNSLESYIYDMRDKMDLSLAEYIDPEIKPQMTSLLTSTENWLFDEAMDADAPPVSKHVFEDKLKTLKTLCDPAVRRYVEQDGRKLAENQLLAAIQDCRLKISNPDPKFAHIAPEKKANIVKDCNQLEAWLSENCNKQNARPRYMDPLYTCQELEDKKQPLINATNKVLAEPAPKAEEPKKEESASPMPPPQGDVCMDPPNEDANMEDVTPPN
eukprot:Platyproteum_vivax@DN7559_c0_g1_i1.p1